MFLGNKGVWHRFDYAIFYTIPYFVLLGSTKIFLVFLGQLVKGSDMFHVVEMYICCDYLINVSGCRLDGKVI